MKIKHWQGYGSVNAKLVKIKSSTTNSIEELTIHVWGNHECGLERYCGYDIYQWLVRKLCKKYKPEPFKYDLVQNFELRHIHDIDNQEAVQYTIYINTSVL